jgi:hypothetical protein
VTRIVTFADGFSSSSAPSISGAVQEVFELLNNQSNTVLPEFVLDETEYKSAFAIVEIERISLAEFRQVIQIHFLYDGSSWSFSTGNSTGSDLLNDTITSDEMVSFTLNNDGEIVYSTGNLPGHIESKIKLSITGITA